GLSPAEENQLGAQAYRQILGKSDVVEGGPAVDVVRRVGRLLAGASNAPEVLERLRLKPRDFAWEFRLVRDRQVNAFCLPGGKVVVYTGILPVCANEAGLATVMGHEIGHALASHGAERMAQERIVKIGQVGVAVSVGDMDPQTQRQVMAVLGAG